MPRRRDYPSRAAQQAAYRKRHSETSQTPPVDESSQTSQPSIEVVPADDSPTPGVPSLSVTYFGILYPPGFPRRQALRDRLDAYKAEYLEAARRQDWATCDRVNEAREPLFYELWELEKDLPPEGRYWFPARVINRGRVFHPELTRKA